MRERSHHHREHFQRCEGLDQHGDHQHSVHRDAHVHAVPIRMVRIRVDVARGDFFEESDKDPSGKR